MEKNISIQPVHTQQSINDTLETVVKGLNQLSSDMRSALKANGNRPNKPCLCGSEKKYKKCCYLLVGTNLKSMKQVAKLHNIHISPIFLDYMNRAQAQMDALMANVAMFSQAPEVEPTDTGVDAVTDSVISELDGLPYVNPELHNGEFMPCDHKVDEPFVVELPEVGDVDINDVDITKAYPTGLPPEVEVPSGDSHDVCEEDEINDALGMGVDTTFMPSEEDDHAYHDSCAVIAEVDANKPADDLNYALPA